MTPRSFKRLPRARQNDLKRSLRGSKKRSQTARRKKDRTKTIPRPSWTHQGPISTAQRRPRGSIWEAKTAPKSIPKRSKIEAKIQDKKRRSKTILDPSWSDLGSILAPSWGQFWQTKLHPCIETPKQQELRILLRPRLIKDPIEGFF